MNKLFRGGIVVLIILLGGYGYWLYQNRSGGLGSAISCSPRFPDHSSSSVVILVYEKANCRPISKASVNVLGNFFDKAEIFGKKEEKQYKTNSNGIIVLQNTESAGGVSEDERLLQLLQEESSNPSIAIISKIEVTKEGYMDNGFNSMRSVGNEILFFLSRKNESQRLIIIGHDTEPDALYSRREYFTGDALDVESLTQSPPTYYEALLPVEKNAPYDFKFVEVGNEAPERNVIGKGFAIIEFAEKGGVQEIDGPTGLDNAKNKYYGFLNLTNAPIDGYLQTLQLESGHSYVAKTRDGDHYFKFTTFITKNLKGQSFIKLEIYLQPDKKRAL